MRRTTICRSSAVLAAVLAATALAGRAMAQAPPAIQRPIQQAQRAQGQAQAATQAQTQPQQPAAPAQQPTVGAPSQPLGQAPASHVVQQGETLWSLAQQFLGDPLLWPEIYRLNTAVVEDPHWIFPGEELRLSASAEDQAAPAQPEQAAPPAGQPAQEQPAQEQPAQAQPEQAPPGGVSVTPAGGEAPKPQPAPRSFAATSGPTIFAAPPAVARGNGLELRDMRNYRAVREGEYFSSGFLTEGQELNTGTIESNLQTSSLGAIPTRTSALQYDELVIQNPPGDSLRIGDHLLVFRRGDGVSGFGEVVIPTGMLRVSGRAGDRTRATVIAMYQAVRNGQEVLKVAPFTFSSNRQPVAVTRDPIEGRVLRLRDAREVATLQGVLFIDKGAEDGVQLGDVFQIYHSQDGAIEQDQARAIVVNTRSHSCTAVIIELYRPDISSQSDARQVRRMPS